MYINMSMNVFDTILVNIEYIKATIANRKFTFLTAENSFAAVISKVV